MTKKIPMPRRVRMSLYSPGEPLPDINPDGTWLESEALCYPSGGMLRRARVWMPDGTLRVVRCGIPDTMFSIPARVDCGGYNLTGYVTGREVTEGHGASYEFVPYNEDLWKLIARVNRGMSEALQAHPNDALHWGIVADWLEEQGKPMLAKRCRQVFVRLTKGS